MKRLRIFSPVVIAIVAAIGCGSGKPQAAETPATAPAVPAATAHAAKGSAVIKGTATLSGAAPKA